MVQENAGYANSNLMKGDIQIKGTSPRHDDYLCISSISIDMGYSQIPQKISQSIRVQACQARSIHSREWLHEGSL